MSSCVVFCLAMLRFQFAKDPKETDIIDLLTFSVSVPTTVFMLVCCGSSLFLIFCCLST